MRTLPQLGAKWSREVLLLSVYLCQACGNGSSPSIAVRDGNDIPVPTQEEADAQPVAPRAEIVSAEDKRDKEKVVDNSNPENSAVENFFEAIRKGLLDTVIVLVETKSVDINEIDPNNSTEKPNALMIAVKAQRFAIVDYLITSGINLSAQDALGHDIHFYLEDNLDGSVKDLMTKVVLGEEIKSEELLSPLYWGAKTNGIDLLDYVIKKGVDINEFGFDDQGGAQRLTALGVAAQSHVLATEFLLDRGADLNKNKRGLTPLAAAIMAGNYNTFRVLLDRNADYSIKAGRDTLLDLAQSYQRTNPSNPNYPLMVEALTPLLAPL